MLRLARNRGKGEAVRQGVLHCLASGRAPDYVGFLDADLAVDPCEATRLTEALEGEPAAWMACASRWRRLGAEIRRAPLRAALGRLMAALVSLAVGAAFYDSQCGAKVFRAEVADILFGAPFLSRWLFDVELLLRLCSGVRRGAGR